MRVIDADVLIPKIKFVLEAEHQIYGEESWDFAGKCLDEIEHAPTIEPERKPGKWIDDCECSSCHWIHEDDEWHALLTRYNFCPNCGSPMVKGEQDV